VAWRKMRVTLLHRDLGTALAPTWDTHVMCKVLRAWHIQSQLGPCTRRITAAAMQCRIRLATTLEAEIEEALRDNDKARAWRLVKRVQCLRRTRGDPKRMPVCKLDFDEWKTGAARPAREGGFAATVIHWPSYEVAIREGEAWQPSQQLPYECEDCALEKSEPAQRPEAAEEVSPYSKPVIFVRATMQETGEAFHTPTSSDDEYETASEAKTALNNAITQCLSPSVGSARSEPGRSSRRTSRNDMMLIFLQQTLVRLPNQKLDTNNHGYG
jgi:hypothetical protein